MQYMLSFMEPEEIYQKYENPETRSPSLGAWMAYIGAMREAGVMVGGHGLLPPRTGTIVRIRDGARQVADGPYPDTKEQLGGYVVLDVPDLDAALEWAARAPAAEYGSVEVRPVMPPMPPAGSAR
ncbi:YciI family protein [Prosthecomicrobium sp. N25]|uniref:YciI family protein n=1 Tax=Prosthecomicrobium sp. N25 TaxID=3129254 RepID=UPI0030770AC9